LPSITATTRRRIYVRDEGRCWRCGKAVRWEDYDLGHIQAQALGGGNEDSNLAVEHKRCNRVAGQRLRQPGIGALPCSSPSRW
jgi:5-methylcytosine-specific restriction endonuclease McrA